jgi:hypothetical protein
MAASRVRTQRCDRREASNRLAQAEQFLFVAELVLDDGSDVAGPGVAGALTVLAGIAASDAACCARLGERPRGDAHHEAVGLLATVEPGGKAMAKDLKRLLDRKDDAQYGMAFLGMVEARKMVTWAKRLLDGGRVAVEA